MTVQEKECTRNVFCRGDLGELAEIPREREMEEILRGRESALTDVKDTWMDVWKGDDLFVRKLFKSK